MYFNTHDYNSAMPDDEMQSADTRSGVFNAAAIVGVAFTVSRLLGFAREIVFNNYYAVDSTAATAFATVSWIPELIFNVIAGGALGSAFIPIFAAYFVRRDAKGAWRLFSAIFNLVIIAATITSLVVALLTPWIIDTFFSALAADPALRETMIALLRLLLVTPVLFGAGGVVTASLHARQQFLWPSLAPIVYNLGIILGIVAFQPDVLGIAYGSILGALGYLLIQLPSLKPIGAQYRPIIRTHDGSIGQVVVLMVPRVLGLSFSFLNLAVFPYVAQTMEDGSIRALQLGYKLMLLPSAIFGQALGIASFPTFSTLAAANRLPEMRTILADTVRLIVFLGLPITTALVFLSIPVSSLMFLFSEGDEQSITYTAWALLFFAPAVVALAGIEVVARAFYAMKDTVTPVVLGAAQLLLMYLLSIWLGRIVFPEQGWLSFGGVALGFSIANWLELIALLLLLSRKMHGIGAQQMWSGVWRMGLAALAMALAMWTTVSAFPAQPDPTLWQLLWILLLPSLAGGIVYLGVCRLLRVRELSAIVGVAMRRVRR
ncbi:MAG: murein biosynthesis integral membrane protein MurJ [Anaerolineae bacterium]|nr:murein biosynthesis integral membrane protein MurJ [Anaerolineae bacterium]